ncbi:MAG TPA: TonB-dependent receptor [Candidatus Angelobacter sp.]
MRKSLLAVVMMILMSALFQRIPAGAQERKGTITGRVADATHAVIKGARVELQPSGQTTVSDDQGQFLISGVAPGRYTIAVSAVGFAQFSSNDLAVTAGGVVSVDATLQVGARTEVVEVRAGREHGEVEAINRERTADNILQVLPAEVITSLPNANIADAIGRLPSVTLERDEGEGKYVQVRGTEPRLTNVTIDGINVPSPESGVRQIKLDAMVSDLVESVEINKTLQANQDGDGIGGSVNLKTKTAGDAPTVIVYGLGGYTPIIGGRGVDNFGATVGQRFGPQKRLGVLIGTTYDWNGRGINDIEPVPTVSSLTPHYDTMDLRDYTYYRTRWGLGGSVDYKFSEGSNIYLRGLYSDFKDYGEKWVYTLTDGPTIGPPVASLDWRRPDFAIGNLVLGGRHLFHNSWLNWDTSVARSRTLNESDGGANFVWAGDPNVTTNCLNVPAKDAFRPQFSAGCFTPGIGDTTDINNYVLTGYTPPSSGLTAQLNLQGSASFGQQYHWGSHYGTIEFGAKIRNAHKFDNSTGFLADFTASPVPGAQFLGTTHPDPNYYDKTYSFTNAPSYPLVRTFADASGQVVADPNSIGSHFDLIERVTAGYVMNSLDITPRIRLVGGVRFEATHVATLSFDSTTSATVPGGTDYLDVLPSVSLRFGLTKDSALRAVFSRGLARPDPQDLAQARSPLITTQTPNTISINNPNLKAEHSNNYDLLYEQYLNPVGMIQAGFFYKQLGDPIVNGLFQESPSLFPGANSPFVLVSQVENIGSAHVEGFEVAYTQRLRFMPGVMKGAGISANYSYTHSGTSGLQGILRDDNPDLLRQAPHTWNISPTFDTKRFSLRMGMTYNSTMIFAYQFKDLQADPNLGIIPLPPCVSGGPCDGVVQQTAGGAKGPGGDNYLYSHFQLDAQASYKLAHGFSVYAYGLNLTNEPFGFYNGSPQYVVQREYYHPTYAGGVRWTLGRETQ